MVMAAIAGGIAGTASQMATGAVKGHQQRKFARETREWNLEQQNSAYQRATKDMRAAGLNPMLMYGGGSAAMGGSESGATDPGGPAGPDIASAYASQSLMRKQGNLVGEQAAAATATAGNQSAQATLNSALATLAEAKIPRAKLEERLALEALIAATPVIDAVTGGISAPSRSKNNPYRDMPNKNRPNKPKASVKKKAKAKNWKKVLERNRRNLKGSK